MSIARETRQMTRRKKSFFALFRVFGGLVLLFLLAAGGIAAEVRREQFSKADLDVYGYPTDTTLATELGRSEARRDLSNGVVRLPSYGLPLASAFERDRILLERYNIHRLSLGGCIVSQGLVSYADGYYEVSRSFIDRKYGTNLLKQVQAEAEKAWEARSSRKSPRTPDPNEYRIKVGDTLIRIAREHGVTVNDLMDANPAVDPTKLRINQVLLVPPPRKR